MGAACGCASKDSEDEVTATPSDIILSKKFPFETTPRDCTSSRISVTMVDLEKEFEALLETIVIQNPIVSAKRKELGPFKYRYKNDLSLLNIVNNEKSATGEAFYGFM